MKKYKIYLPTFLGLATISSSILAFTSCSCTGTSSPTIPDFFWDMPDKNEQSVFSSPFNVKKNDNLSFNILLDNLNVTAQACSVTFYRLNHISDGNIDLPNVSLVKVDDETFEYQEQWPQYEPAGNSYWNSDDHKELLMYCKGDTFHSTQTISLNFKFDTNVENVVMKLHFCNLQWPTLMTTNLPKMWHK